MHMKVNQFVLESLFWLLEFWKGWEIWQLEYWNHTDD